VEKNIGWECQWGLQNPQKIVGRGELPEVMYGASAESADWPVYDAYTFGERERDFPWSSSSITAACGEKKRWSIAWAPRRPV
jgi:hypothetical protein